MANGVIEARVSLKGRPIQDYRISESLITIGRDPQSTIFLDNPGVSRCHAILERDGDEIHVQDQESANGTFLNEERVRRSKVRDGDKLRVGKFLVEIRLKQDRRGSASASRPQGAAHEGTMVLETGQIERLLEQTKKAEEEAADHPPVRPAAVAEGNVLRMHQPSQSSGPMVSSEVEQTPRGLSAAWWRSQAMGLALGFSLGVLCGIWITKALMG